MKEDYIKEFMAMTVKELDEIALKFPDADIKKGDAKAVKAEKLAVAKEAQEAGKGKKSSYSEMFKGHAASAERVEPEPYVAIDKDIIGTRGPVTEDDLLTPKEKDLKTLTDNMARKGSTLIGTFRSVMRFYDDEIDKNVYYAEVLYGESETSVIIPFDEFVIGQRGEVVKKALNERADNENLKKCSYVPPEKMSDDEIKDYLNLRLGSPISFMVLEMEEKIIGSRVAAAEKECEFWDLKSLNPETGKVKYQIREGKTLVAQIVAVEYAGIYIEAFGYEFFIPKIELWHNPRADMREHFYRADMIQLLVKKVTRDKDGTFLTAAFSYLDYKGNDEAKDIVESLFKENQEITGEIVSKEYDRKNGYRYYVDYKGVEIACFIDKKMPIRPMEGDFATVVITDTLASSSQVRGIITYFIPGALARALKNKDI